MLRKLLFTLFLAVFSVPALLAQVGQGSLQGKILDTETGEPLPFANVVVLRNGNQVAGTTTDFDGQYSIKPLAPGTYDLQVTYVGYQTQQINDVIVNADKITFQNMKITQGISLDEVEIISYTVPLIEKDNNSSGATVTKEQFDRLPTRSATGVAKTVGGVVTKDDGSGDLNIRGSRSSGSDVYIDGVKVIGSQALPRAAISQVTVITAGIPAQYGDVVGGITNVTTRGSSPVFFGGVEYVTSGFKVSDDKVVGLDNYGYNSAEFSVGGPIITKKDESGKITDVPFGFILSGNFTNVVDPRPSPIDIYKVKDDVLEELKNDPIRLRTTSGTAPNAEYLGMDAFEVTKFRRNVADQSYNLSAKFDWKTSETTALTFGGRYFNRDQNSPVRSNDGAYQLYNTFNNPQSLRTDYSVFGRFTQRFDNSSEDEGKNLISNAFFSIQVDYSKSQAKTQDESYKDDFWKYGYVGKFTSYTEPTYAVPEKNNGVLVLNGQEYKGEFLDAFRKPLYYGFTPSDVNIYKSNYTETYYGFENQLGRDAYKNRVEVQKGALVNGDAFPSIYGIWSSPGDIYNSYSKIDNDQIRVSGVGSADIGDHAITLGFEYEQRTYRNYSLDPRDLWNVGRQQVNSNIDAIDSTSFTVDYSGSIPRITFDRLYGGDSTNTAFSHNFRTALGLDPRGLDYIDFDSYDLDVYKMEYFDANTLINPANKVNMTYAGFDYKGDKLTSNPTLDDFFNARDELGNFKREIPAFSPIYTAFYVQDKFSFDDLVFRLGVRVDRFDANQPVLKDNYTLFPTRDAKYVRELISQAGGQGNYTIPSNIGDDYVVYVGDDKNPSIDNITGYRNGDTYYNAQGEEIQDPTAIRGKSGVSPWLVDPSRTQPSTEMTSASFKDYDPQWTFMPRISFSFPISDEALFFANYDILSQRPSEGVRIELIDYLYIKDPSGGVVNNPSLKPEKTINYELGFKQTLSSSSAMQISAFYREQRDMIQVRKLSGAYPADYITYDNIDFGTVKGLTFSYDLRRTKNISIRASYTLQFAEGTGSDATSAFTLARAGDPSLRAIFPYSFDQRHQVTGTFSFRYGEGDNYNGPVWGGTDFLANSGISLTFTGGSGTPYTARSEERALAQFGASSAPVEGGINGSRLPAIIRMDARVDKDFKLYFGSNEDGTDRKSRTLTVYLQVLNLLNSQNILNVYGYTGNPLNDGYLASLRGITDAVTRVDPNSYRTHYNLKIQNPYNYELARRIRLGLQMYF